MRIKNVSRKVIGNQEFRLLPGESMEVKGNELWVKMYLADGKLIKEAEQQQDPSTEPIPEENSAESEDQAESADISAEYSKSVDAAAESRKKGGRKKTESTE